MKFSLLTAWGDSGWLFPFISWPRTIESFDEDSDKKITWKRNESNYIMDLIGDNIWFLIHADCCVDENEHWYNYMFQWLRILFTYALTMALTILDKFLDRGYVVLNSKKVEMIKN